jgi:hypothetical protein
MRPLLRIVALVAFVAAALPTARADESAKSQEGGKPIQLALFDPVQIFPRADGISGFRLNIIYSQNAFMNGFDLGFIVNEITGNVAGVEWGLVNLVGGNFGGWQYGFWNQTHGDFAGWQQSFVTITDKKFEGLQTGVYNTAGDAAGLQLGLVNHAVTMNGLQLGIVNIIEKGGMLPVFVIFNASFR